MKEVLRGKFMALSPTLKQNLERFYISNLTAHLKALDQKEETTFKRNRLEEINSGLKLVRQRKENTTKNQ